MSFHLKEISQSPWSLLYKNINGVKYHVKQSMRNFRQKGVPLWVQDNITNCIWLEFLVPYRNFLLLLEQCFRKESQNSSKFITQKEKIAYKYKSDDQNHRPVIKTWAYDESLEKNVFRSLFNLSSEGFVASLTLINII